MTLWICVDTSKPIGDKDHLTRLGAPTQHAGRKLCVTDVTRCSRR
jgi:hypothetical protein